MQIPQILVRALQSAAREAPILDDVMMRITDGPETPAETAAIEAIAVDITELLESDERPGDAVDPIALALHRYLRALCRRPDPYHGVGWGRGTASWVSVPGCPRFLALQLVASVR